MSVTKEEKMYCKVTYQSMSAYYTSIVDAKNEHEAKRKFAGNAFRESEWGLIKARPAQISDFRRDDED